MIFNNNNKLQRDTNRHIHTIAIKNGCNTQVVHIFFEERDGKSHFKGNIPSRIQNPVELSHGWVLTNFKYQEPAFYSILFDKYEEVPFEVLPVCMKICVI